MNNKKATKRALLTSVMALVMCVVMLVGTTFAWFTDTASTGVNKIVAGNLDIELEYKNKAEGDFIKADKDTPVFNNNALWEPGHVEYAVLKVSNVGNLALKYKLGINVASETGSTNVYGDAFKLSEYIHFKVLDGDKSDLGRDALAAESGVDTVLNKGYTAEKHLVKGTENTVTLVVWMPTTVGNEANHAKDAAAPVINLGINVVATQDTVEEDSFGKDYDAQAEYPTLTTAATIDEAFPGVNFSSDNTNTESIVLDGRGVTAIENWADYYFTTDTTIKGVTFKNGASFTAKKSDITVTLEDCTFYACDQQKAATTLGITDNNGTGNNGRNNILTNTGAGMCLNLEQKGGTSDVKLIVKGCTFVGENNETLKVYGNKYGADGKVVGAYKARGFAIALNAISGGGTAGQLDSLLIEDCTINGVRGNAIQLYGKTGDITIKDTKINSWGVNDGDYRNEDGTVKDNGSSYAVRGDLDANGSRTLKLDNVFFGLDEGSAIGHVKVGSFSGNTVGTRTAGTY